MKPITDVAALEAIYGAAVPASLDKVGHRITPLVAQWIGASRLVMLTTVGPEGTDCSPRGDVDPVVRIADDQTLLLPDWQGNNRIDSLRNIVRDGRVSLMFLVPGCTNVLRVNGTAIVTADPATLRSFEQKGRHPRSVVVVTLAEVYGQCAKAILRSALWDGRDDSAHVPTMGQLIKEQKDSFDAEDYDTDYATQAQDRMW